MLGSEHENQAQNQKYGILREEIKMAKTKKMMFYGTGRRKSSIARVRLVEGTGK